MTGRECFLIKRSRHINYLFLILSSVSMFYSAGIYPRYSDEKLRSNWYWSQPLPTGNILYSVHFTSRLTGYAAGAYGTILKTTNSGIAWSSLSSNTFNDLSEIFFLNNSDGFVVGKSGKILKTTDGGSSWKNIPSGVNSYFQDIVFTNGPAGYCAGYNGTILKSTDKGNSWSLLNTGTAAPLFCIDFLNEYEGAAGGYNVLLKTSDAGKSWKFQNINFSPAGSIVGISYIDDQTIYAAGNIPGGVFYKTTNGGNNWESYSLGLPNIFDGSVDLVRSMSFFNVNMGFIVTDFGTILKTTNGGNNWLKDSSFRPSYMKLSVMYDVSVNDSTCINIAGGGGALISSTDAGHSWTEQTGNKKTIKKSWFINSLTGFAAGERGEILKTKDAGVNWHVQNKFSTKFLNSVFFVNDKTGFVAGDSGAIFKTTNGGSNWIDQTNYKRYNINSIYFTNEESGIVAGGNPENGRAFIYKTADGGSSWYEVYDSISLGVLNSVDFINETNGVSVGTNGNVLYSYDAGESWITINVSPVDLYSISFADNMNGLISGANGLFYRTSDGGISWNTIVSGYYKKMYSVKFKENNFAAAAGENGTVLFSYNGGYNWSSEINITYNDLYSIEIINNNKAEAFGEYGTIIYSKMNKSLMTSESSEYPNDKGYTLSPNFPNPFNPVTHLEFGISNPEFVSLKVFDMSGKEVKVFLNEYKPAGQHQIIFDGSDLSSGVYFFSLYLNHKRTQTRRMVLLK